MCTSIGRYICLVVYIFVILVVETHEGFLIHIRMVIFPFFPPVFMYQFGYSAAGNRTRSLCHPPPPEGNLEKSCKF